MIDFDPHIEDVLMPGMVNNSELVTGFSIIAVSLRTKYSSGQ